jgi:ABC-type bacteriocin/lantibiotic exporter with double-glycine peptidase domain
MDKITNFLTGAAILALIGVIITILVYLCPIGMLIVALLLAAALVLEFLWWVFSTIRIKFLERKIYKTVKKMEYMFDEEYKQKKKEEIDKIFEEWEAIK